MLDAVLMAVRRRRPRGALVHSDQGTQFGSGQGTYGDSARRPMMRVPRRGGAAVEVLRGTRFCGMDAPYGADSLALIYEYSPHQIVLSSVDPFRGRLRQIGKFVTDSTMIEWSSDCRVSNDGRRIAVVILENPARVHVLDLATGAWRAIPLRLPPDMADTPIDVLAWEHGGHGLFVAASNGQYGRVLYADLDGRTKVIFDTDGPGQLSIVQPSPDGKRLAFTSGSASLNAWLLENF